MNIMPLSFDACDEILELIQTVLTSDDLDPPMVQSVIQALELVVASHLLWAETPSRRAEAQTLAARLAGLRADLHAITPPVVSRYEVH